MKIKLNRLNLCFPFAHQAAQYAQRLRSDRGQVTISILEQGEEDELTAEEREVRHAVYYRLHLIYVFTNVIIYICVSICIYIYIYIYKYIYICIYMYIYIYICICTYKYGVFMYVCVYVYINIIGI